jgi:hypothetical protein
MIVVYEPQCRGIEHAEINAAFLMFLVKAKPYESIVVFAEESHIHAIRLIIDSFGFVDFTSRVIWSSIVLPKPESSVIQRSLFEIMCFIDIALNKNNRRSLNSFICLSSTSATLLCAKILSYFFGGQIFLILHGILETITNRPQSLLKRVTWFRNYLPINSRSSIRYITTAKYIQANLITEIPSLRHNVSYLDFPYLFEEIRGAINGGNISLPITITSAGVGALKKGTGEFFKMAERMNRNYGDSIRFYYAGRLVDEELKCKIPTCVHAFVDQHMLSATKFGEILRNSNYLVFLYPADSYKFGVSGVFLDAVKYELPIIAIQNDFFKYCTQVIGKIGWLCESVRDVELVISKLILEPPLQEIDEIKTNYKKFKKNHTVDLQTSRLVEILN